MNGRRNPPAIVIGLDCITGLQSARILARHGVAVIGLARDPKHYCCRTRVCERIVETDTASEALIDTLERLSAELGERPVLVPCTDLAVTLVSRHRARLAPFCRFALPEQDVVERLMDKLEFSAHAQAAGLPVPTTHVLRSRADAERAAAELDYPCVLKPPLKTVKWQEQTSEKAFLVPSAAELLALYDRCAGWADTLLAQEWIEGGEENLYSYNGYLGSDSEPLASFVARKLRQWPPGTGTSCLGEECRNDDVLAASLALFRSVGYRGLGYVEMKRCARTGRHVIIEPNLGRPTGRSAIAEAGGVELLYTMYCDLADLPLPERRTQTYGGVKWIYWRRDFQSALHYWRRGELTMRDWWRSWRGPKTTAVWSLRDPRPFFADVARTLAELGRRARRPESPVRSREGVQPC